MKGYLTVGFYPDTEQPGEVFICIAKEGTFVSAVLDQLARQVSFLLQRGCPAKLIMDGWRNHIIDPMGPVEGKDSDGSLFDVLAESFLTCCQNYGDCEPDKDHMRRLVP